MDNRRPLRNSHQRQLVLSIVKSSYNHPIADEVYEIARYQDSSISKGTVYRNLNLLADLGEIRKLHMPFGPDHYDFNLVNHYHFICRCCNKVVDASIPYHDELNQAQAQLPGYLTEWHKLILVGLCAECNSRQNEIQN